MGAYGKNIPLFPYLVSEYPEGHPLAGQKRYPDYDQKRNGPYPKMLSEPASDEYIRDFKEKNSYLDSHSGRVCYTQVAPKLGALVPMLSIGEDVDAGFALMVGHPIIVENMQRERDFLAHRARLADGDRGTSDKLDELEQLRAENERLRSQLAAPAVAPAKRRGRPPKQAPEAAA